MPNMRHSAREMDDLLDQVERLGSSGAILKPGDGIEIEGGVVSLPEAFYNYLVDKTYAAPEVAAFAVSNLGGTVEIGASVTVSEFTHRETNIGNITALAVYYEGQPLETVTPSASSATGTFDGSVTVTRTSAGSRTFTLSGMNSKGGSFIATVSKSFYNPVFWGAAAEPQTVDGAFLGGLSNHPLSNQRNRTINVNAGTGQYIWYAVPVRLGECTFTVGIVTGGFQLVGTISYTNGAGFSENYYVYRSDNPSLGSTEVIVS